jgi:hypothetical protein
VKQIRKRLTYANVVSSIALFLVLGGATAFAAKKISSSEISSNSITTGKIKKEAVSRAKLKNASVDASKLAKEAVIADKLAKGAVTTDKLADSAVTTGKIAKDAVTGDKVNELTLGEVPKATSATNATNATNATSATNAVALGGVPASGYSRRLFARVSYSDATPTIIASSPGVVANGEGALGFPRVIFPQAVNNCAVIGGANTGAGTQTVRRSSTVSGADGTVQMAIHDDAGTSVRADFEIIAVC